MFTDLPVNVSLFCLKVFIGSGFYAAFRVTLVANALEGTYDGAVHITTDYEVSRCVSPPLLHLSATPPQLTRLLLIGISFLLDINHPGESAYRGGHINQLPQSPHPASFISSK